MFKIIENKGKWYIQNIETGTLAMRGAGFTDRDDAQRCMEILQHPPTVEDIEAKEDSIRAKRP